MILDILKDTLLDTIKLIPFLFVAFLIIELIEHKMSDKNEKILKKAGRFGPVLGGVLGAIPQCGFSVLASNLYVTRIISLGTLISIYLSTSDEMLPILLSNGTAISKVIIILLIKVIIGIICGLLIDLFIRKNEHEDYHICEDEKCECEESIIKSSIIHTSKTLTFIFLVTLILNTLFSFVNQEFIGSILLNNVILVFSGLKNNISLHSFLKEFIPPIKRIPFLLFSRYLIQENPCFFNIFWFPGTEIVSHEMFR